jgi:hypothetical protein
VNASAVKVIIAALAVFTGGVATYAGHGPIASSHLFAPALHITCVSPDHVVTSWVPDSQMGRVTAGGGQPGNVVHWLGYTEIGGCGQSLVIHTGVAP